MASVTAPRTFAEKIMWDSRVKPALIALVVGVVGYLVGTYFVAPRAAQQQPTYLTTAFASLPSGFVVLANEDGPGALLPVRVADTGTARDLGFRQLGEQALENTFLLYVLTRETTTRASYSVEGLRAPVEFAAVDATGTVLSVTAAPLGTARVSIAERHQWLLVAKAGTLARFGVTVGSSIDPARVTKF